MLLSCKQLPKICWVNQKLYYYFQRVDSIVHTVSAKDEICYAKRLLLNLQNLDCKYFVQTKTLYVSYLLKYILSMRYLHKFDFDFLSTDRICKDLLKETWKIVKEDEIKFRKKFILRLFSAFPSLYRLFRIATDRTLLKWEKQQKDKRRSIK